MEAHSPSYAGIIKKQTPDYNFFIKDDGTDYLKIWSDVRQGRLPEQDCKLLRKTLTVEVYLVNAAGRQFIFKIDRGYPHHLDSKIWRLILGPFYSTQMKVINRAVNNGNKATADFYLVAEERSGLISRESHILMEYLQGHTLRFEKSIAPFHDQLVALFNDLHANRMALCDVHADNIFVTPDGLRVIDLSWRGSFWTGKAKDTIFLKSKFGVELPDRTTSDKLAVLCMRAMYRMRAGRRKLKSLIKGDKDKKAQ